MCNSKIAELHWVDHLVNVVTSANIQILEAGYQLGRIVIQADAVPPPKGARRVGAPELRWMGHEIWLQIPEPGFQFTHGRDL